MIGALAGDIIGSPYEFDHNNIKTTDFPLFTRRSHFTDDSILTVATAEVLLTGGDYADVYKEYHDLYPTAGWGSMFASMARGGKLRPYNSFGNGAAMRVAPIGFAFGTLEDTLAEAKRSSEVTHNHPEGVKGAQATAAAIFLARTGKSKAEIKAYITETFGYDLSRTLDQIRPYYFHVESCQEMVPEAITAFLESEDFEDAIRKAVSLGGDSDTLACITGGIAEAFYNGVPAPIATEVLNRLDVRLGRVVRAFTEAHNPSQCLPGSVEQTLNLWSVRHWNAPDWHTCHGIQLEGKVPPEALLAFMAEQVAEARRVWQPGREAWEQLETIRAAVVGRWVIVKIWDLFVATLDEDEGPYPIRGRCTAVETRPNAEGLTQAYLRLEETSVIPNGYGSDTRNADLERDAEGVAWINLGKLHEIQVLVSNEQPLEEV